MVKPVEAKKETKVVDDKNVKGDVEMEKATKAIQEDAKFERNTRIEKSSNNRTIKNLFKNKDKLRFDLAIQRNEVWSLEQKSNLIHSILYGFPVPPVMVQETDDEFIWFLDGKQRISAILSYISGDFTLSKKTSDVFSHKIAGHKFSDLSEDMKDIIYDETIQLIKLKHMTDEERDEMFVRWNSGSSLSKIELTRAMHSDLIEQINYIADLEFFADDIALTSKARNRFVDQEIILQISMLLDEGKDKIKGFGSPQIKDYVLRLKASNQVLADSLVEKFEIVSHYLNMSVSDFELAERKKALKKIHIPMIFFTAIKAMEYKLKPKLFGDFIRTFLISTYSIESDYGQSCQSSSSKKENVQIRLHEMNMAFEEFLNVIEDTASSKEDVDAVKVFEEELAKEVEKQVEVNVLEEDKKEEKIESKKEEGKKPTENNNNSASKKKQEKKLEEVK